MRRALVGIVFAALASALVIAGCSLNPQPLPPATADGGNTPFDASTQNGDATGLGSDAGSGEETGPTPGTDASVLDAATDADDASETEAGDASDVDASDASTDARDEAD